MLYQWYCDMTFFVFLKLKKKNYTGIVTDDMWHSPTVHSDSVVTVVLLLNGPIWVEDNNQILSADKTTIKW